MFRPLDHVSINSAILLFMMIVALFLRLYGLEEYAFGDDELWHLVVSNQDNIGQLITYNFEEEVHPPLSYIIWHLALQISDNEIWLRMPGIIAGIALIPSVYIFGRLYIGRYGGYGLAFLFAFSPLLIAISVSVRAYSFMMLCLVWAAIFAHQYCYNIDQSRRKSLRSYAICCFLAISLNHAACFAIFSLGLAMLFQSFRQRNKKDFVCIAAIHALLIAMILGYLLILTVYFGFEGLTIYFSDKRLLIYILQYIAGLLFLIQGFELEMIGLGLMLAFIAVPFLLIERRQYLLLTIIFAPFLVIVMCDYFTLYPYSSNIRNNLFLCLSFSVLYAYVFQLCGILFDKYFSTKLVIHTSQIIVVLMILMTAKHLIDNNLARHQYPLCQEFAMTKSDVNRLQTQIKKRNHDKNIFVTVPRNMWYWKYYYGEQYITVLGDHLSKFENEEITIYFDAAPPITHSTTVGMYDYQLVLRELFAHLEKTDALSDVDSITFFDIGLNIDFLSRSFHPQFIPPDKKDIIVKGDDWIVSCKRNIRYDHAMESYYMSWAINNSSEVLDRVYHSDRKFDCGREMFLLRVTPQFVRDEILNKHYPNYRTLEKTTCVK